MDKKELLSRLGSIQQLAYVRPVSYQEGRARNLSAYVVKNGPMSFTVMADKCLDVAEFSYKGTNISFLAKPGLMGRSHFDTHGDEALRSIMGGLLFTCGLENICAPCSVDGKDYPMHGRIRTTPAEHVAASAAWEGDDYKIRISGEMREAELFGENMVLRRSIETTLGSQSIVIRDEIENEAFRAEPMMLLYHFNFGFPLLSERSRVVLPTLKVTPRDDVSTPHVSQWGNMVSPRDSEPEHVFIHELAADEQGNTFAAVFNEELNIGLKIEFNKTHLPYFMQWKSLALGDYVLGLEPSNSSVYGKKFHLENDTPHLLGSFCKESTELRITMLEGNEDFNALLVSAEKLINACQKER